MVFARLRLTVCVLFGRSSEFFLAESCSIPKTSEHLLKSCQVRFENCSLDLNFSWCGQETRTRSCNCTKLVLGSVWPLNSAQKRRNRSEIGCWRLKVFAFCVRSACCARRIDSCSRGLSWAGIDYQSGGLDLISSGQR